MINKSLTHVVGFDDAPRRAKKESVCVVGAVYSRRRLVGVLSVPVTPDGDDATSQLIACLVSSKYLSQLHAILLQGITFAGFNVVDIWALHRATGRSVVTVMRRRPDMQAIHAALLANVTHGAHKWHLIQSAGPVRHGAGVYLQVAGIPFVQAEALVRSFQYNGLMPEPLRVAHLVAAGVTVGESRHRP